MTFELVRLSQRDPKWKDKKLGNSSLTLGYFGCAVSSVAMLLSGHGYPETPETLNEKLKKSGGFMDAAIVWAAVGNLYPKAKFKNLVICRDSDAPIDAISASIEKGQPVILEVDYSPQKGIQTHWVVAYKKVGKDFYILDPYPQPTENGKDVSLMQRYSHGKDFKRSITAVVWYEVQPSNYIAPPAPPIEETGLTLQVVGGLASPGLRLRSLPSTASDTLSFEGSGARLRVIEPESIARPKIGIFDQWIRVRDAEGNEGYVAAWYVELTEQADPTPEPIPPTDPTPPQPVPVGPIARTRPSVGDGLESTPLPAPNAEKRNAKPNQSATHRLAADIWNRYGGLLGPLAKTLGIEPGVAVATLAVESGGQAFGPDGKMIIRFENHVFYSQWGKNNAAKFAQHFVYNNAQTWTGHKWRPTPGEAWRPTNLAEFHGSQTREWDVLNFACTLADSAAKMSISMGAPQIMGFNYDMIGFASVQDMFNAFSAGERDQIIGFFDFVKNVSPNAVKALQTRDFKTFATYYNGSGQAVMYGNLIKASYDAFKDLQQVSQPLPEPEPQPEPVPPTPQPQPQPEPVVPPTPQPQPEPMPPTPQPEPPAPKPDKEKIYVLVSKSVGSSGLRMRKQASQASTLAAVQPAGTRLRILDDPGIAKPKIGKQNAWLWVRDRQDRDGYVAAWFVELDKEKSELKESDSVSFDISDFTEVAPEVLEVHVSGLARNYGGLRLRQTPGETGITIKKLAVNTPLTVLDDLETAIARIGKFNMWLKVREPLGSEGFVAAWFVEK